MTKKITYRQMIAEFLSFLKENNALQSYKKALIKQKRLYFKTIENHINPFTIKPIIVLLKPGGYEELINMAFIWDNTKEKHKYWEKLDHKWRRRIKDIELQIVNEKIYK